MMVSQAQDGPSRTSAKATNQGGRPRKYATAAEARAHETEKQRLKRHRHQRLRKSNDRQSTSNELQFVQYQAQATNSGLGLPTRAVQKEDELERPDFNPKATLLERMDRMEVMLCHLTRKVDTLQPDQRPMKDLLETEDEVSIDSEANESAPVLKLFDYVLAGRQRDVSKRSNDSKFLPGTTSTLSPESYVKAEKLRNTLAALLPPQRDLDLIAVETDAWALLKPICILLGDMYDNYDLSALFDLSYIATCHPTIIARSLIYISLSIQQLPPDFDRSRLSFGHDIDKVLNKYTSTVSELITSNDELAGSIEGLECAILLTFYHINAGNLRRAWLPCRRALNIAQMKGFHRETKRLAESLGPTKATVSKNMWYKVVGLDRFLAIILGLPVGSKRDKFGPDERINNPRISLNMIFLRRLSNITNSIIERNDDDSSNMFTLTQEIDEEMDMLRKEMPQEYWDIPPAPVGKKFEADDMEYIRLTSHTWFFHLEIFLHLPYMLRASTETRYEYNKARCLTASRELTIRYLASKQSGPKICCKILDFAGFTAGIILALNLISSPRQSGSMERKNRKDRDRSLLQNLITCFDTLASDPRDVVAAQSVVVIRKVLAFNYGTMGETRLTIPYLGTVTIVHYARGVSQPQSQGRPSQQNTCSNMTDNADFLYNQQQHMSSNQTGDPGYTPPHDFSFNSNGPTGLMDSFSSSQFGSMDPDDLAIPNVGWTDQYYVYFDDFSASDITGFDSLEF